VGAQCRFVLSLPSFAPSFILAQALGVPFLSLSLELGSIPRAPHADHGNDPEAERQRSYDPEKCVPAPSRSILGLGVRAEERFAGNGRHRRALALASVI
jgi:hypothetical protein